MNILIDSIQAAGERIKEERLRLGMSQPDFANCGRVKKGAQINYESGERRPDTLYLQGIAEIGADCQYILTGVRSINMRDVERSAKDQFLEKIPPLVKANKDIDFGMLESIIDDVVRVCSIYPQLSEVTSSDMARAIIQSYKEKKLEGGNKEESELIAKLVASK